MDRLCLEWSHVNTKYVGIERGCSEDSRRYQSNPNNLVFGFRFEAHFWFKRA